MPTREGEEGKFYVWTHAEIVEVLGEADAASSRRLRRHADGNWEGHTILNRLAGLALGSPRRKSRSSPSCAPSY